MSAQDVASAAYGAGFRGQGLVLAIAVGLAESGGDPNAHCLNCAGVSEDSRGLWQINVNAHPEYLSANLYDPNVNAQAAYAISNGGTNWGAWSTYSNGYSYLAWMPQAVSLAAFTGSGVSPVTIPTIALPPIDLSGLGLPSVDLSTVGPVPILLGLAALVLLLD